MKFQDAKTNIFYETQSYRTGKELQKRKIEREKKRALKEDIETLNNLENYLKPIQ